MKRANELSHPMPLHDYSPAVQGAVSWLGDRYLLAEPVQRRRDEHRPYFNEPRHWHPLPSAAVRAQSR